MGTQVDDEGAAAPAPATTAAVIGIMAAIAVVSVTVVVAWARLGPADAADEPSGVEEAVPETLAGGEAPSPVPAEVAAAVDGPVIGAARLEELPDHMLESCTESNGVAWDVGSPDVEYAVITPDGVTAALFGQGAVPGGAGKGAGGMDLLGIRVRCELELDGGSAIDRGGGGYEEVFADQPQGSGHVMGASCCDEDGLGTASATVGIPDEAVWLLQERGSWYLAIPVADIDTVGLTWKFRENRFGGGPAPATKVLFLDAAGDIVAEDFVGGPF